ncbi:MAG: protein translocase subunit SecF [Patescibacteria group bacterium]|jgi:preprotein translocase subunit SecF
MYYRIIQTRNYWYALSAILFAVSIFFIAYWGIKPGIEFTGGSLLELQYTENRPNETDVKAKLADLNLGDIQVQNSGDKGVILKMKVITNDERVNIVNKLKELGAAEELSFEAIGPTIGQELLRKTIWALLIVIFAIIAYVAWSFRKVSLGPVKSWVYGVCAIIALVHDITIVVGFYVVLSHFLKIEVDSLFISALLTILGYSVNDTIVVYDRIRENLKRSSADTFEEVINESINQTITRSLNTGLCALFVLFIMFLFGGESIRYFALTLFVGIVAGTYSSMFVASPFLLIFQKIFKK